jgi:hypothetical protein
MKLAVLRHSSEVFAPNHKTTMPIVVTPTASAIHVITGGINPCFTAQSLK